MELIEGLDQIKKPYRNAVVALGNFDGVHIGHQALLHQVIEKAESIGGTSVAITFEPHPIRVLKEKGHPPLITLYEQKIDLISKTGIDVLICIPFTLEFASITASLFIEEVLVKIIGMKAIIIGEDYNFGKNREGNLDLLKEFGVKLSFDVRVANWILTPGGSKKRISSTRIRKMVMNGEVERAQGLLGRHYQIRGTVETGRNRGGKLLGFPTANIKLHDELCPKTGVYAVTVAFNGHALMGVANIGYSPTFDDHIYTIEVHILDFDEDIYGKNIRVNFIHRIRDEKKFAGIKELSEQIKKDIEKTRQLLAE
ncbi:MAG: bifunctional riboflavin kinase/FAD synthetase [Proteobacteria bacterium]|nr:bifunctional riboflavin kinase/FAD synthetase [Pseudomonadota bacterium]